MSRGFQRNGGNVLDDFDDSVIDYTPNVPGGPAVGDRYLTDGLGVDGTGVQTAPATITFPGVDLFTGGEIVPGDIIYISDHVTDNGWYTVLTSVIPGLDTIVTVDVTLGPLSGAGAMNVHWADGAWKENGPWKLVRWNGANWDTIKDTQYRSTIPALNTVLGDLIWNEAVPQYVVFMDSDVRYVSLAATLTPDFLLLDCSNDPLTGNLDITSTNRINFGAATRFISDDGTNLDIFTSAGDIHIEAAAGMDFIRGGDRKITIGAAVVQFEEALAMTTTEPIRFGAATRFIVDDGADVRFENNGTYIDLLAAAGIAITPASNSVVIGDGGITDYADFGMDGYLTLLGDARVKKEVRLNVVSLAPGASGANQTSFGKAPGWAFTINDDMLTEFEVPPDCDILEDIEISIYWAINEAYAFQNGEVQWECNWSACPSNSTEAVDAPTDTGTIDFGDQNIPATALFLTKISGVIPAGNFDAGDLFALQLKRIALDAGVNPTAEPVMIHVEVEYTADRLGEPL